MDVVDIVTVKFQQLIKYATSTSFPERLLSRAVIAGGIVCGLSILRILYLKLQTKIYHYPPQLYGLPFIGSFATLWIWKSKFRTSILPKYGDVVKYNIGPLSFVKINDIKLGRKIFDIALDRAELFQSIFTNAGVKPFFAFENGHAWSTRRKEIASGLTTMLQKSQVDANISHVLKNIIYEELDKRLDESNNGEIMWNPHKFLVNIAFNTIFLALFNKTLKLDDPIFDEYCRCVTVFFENEIIAALAAKIPSIATYILFNNKVKKFNYAMKKADEIVNQAYEERITSNKDDGIVTLSDIIHSNNTSYSSSSSSSNGNGIILSRDEISADFNSLLHAGIDTTGFVSYTGMLLLAKYSKIQDELYNELNSVFFEDDSFSLSKINQCPKLKAFVNECLRIAVPAPDGGPRSCSKDIRCVKYRHQYRDNNSADGDSTSGIICDVIDSSVWKKEDTLNVLLNENNEYKIEYDYIIPKNTNIELNLMLFLNSINGSKSKTSSRNINLKLWLKNDKNRQKNKEYLMPFGSGPRKCPGQTLSLKEIYSIFGNLLLKYRISPISNKDFDIPFRYNFGDLTRRVSQTIPVMISKR